MDKALQALSIVFALIGTYLLAFGLKIKTGISDDLRKELRMDEKDLIAPSDVRQKTGMTAWGLSLISIAAGIQLYLILR